MPTLVIKNKGTKDIDLGNFVFTAGSKSFNPPSESIIFAGKDIWLSPSVTGFTADDFVNLSVKSKSGQQVTSYSGSKKTAITLVSKINTDPRLINKLLSKNDLANESFVQENPNKLINNDFNTFNSLNSASAGESGMSLKQKPNNLIIWFLFGALVLVGSFIFIKLRSVEIKEADEFTLLEE